MNYKGNCETEFRNFVFWFFNGCSMIYNDYVFGIKDTLKQDLPLRFCRKENKVISILTETHINHDQIHPVINNWLGPIFFSPVYSHTKGLLVLLHLGFEGITEVGTDPKGRFVSFKVTLSNDRVLCVYAPSWYSTREQLAGWSLWRTITLYGK